MTELEYNADGQPQKLPVESADTKQSPASDKGQVVIVDDDPDDIDFLISALTQIIPAERIVTIMNSKSFIQYLEKLNISSHPDLIIMDKNMPDITGKQLIELLKSIPHLKYIPVVVVSGTVHPWEMKDLYEAGASSIMKKPSTFTEWVDLVNSIARIWLHMNMR